MKNEILQTSLQYFLKHGIRKMSNDKLVEILGISTKTLYKYFKNKEDLLEQSLNYYYAQQYELLKKMPKDQRKIYKKVHQLNAEKTRGKSTRKFSKKKCRKTRGKSARKFSKGRRKVHKKVLQKHRKPENLQESSPTNCRKIHDNQFRKISKVYKVY